jgi:hypothetical protein
MHPKAGRLGLGASNTQAHHLCGAYREDIMLW